MATYKDIISTITGKVKEVAESGAVRDIYDRGASRAKSYARIAKLTLEVNGDSEELKKVYTEIGKLYFEQHRTAPDGVYAALFAQAEEISARLRAKEDEINAMKAEFEAEKTVEDADIEVEIGEFEDIVSATEDEGKGE